MASAHGAKPHFPISARLSGLSDASLGFLRRGRTGLSCLCEVSGQKDRTGYRLSSRRRSGPKRGSRRRARRRLHLARNTIKTRTTKTRPCSGHSPSLSDGARPRRRPGAFAADPRRLLVRPVWGAPPRGPALGSSGSAPPGPRAVSISSALGWAQQSCSAVCDVARSMPLRSPQLQDHCRQRHAFSRQYFVTT